MKWIWCAFIKKTALATKSSLAAAKTGVIAQPVVSPRCPGWSLRQEFEPKWERTSHPLSRRAALRRPHDLARRVEFDTIHHLPYCRVRARAFLGALGAPLIVGPLGGRKTSPPSSKDGLRCRIEAFEKTPDLSNSTITTSLLVRPGPASADVAVASTADTKHLFSGTLHNKTVVVTALGVLWLPTPRMPPTCPELPRFFLRRSSTLLERNACGGTRLAEVARQMGYRRPQRRHARYLRRSSEVLTLA
jgi:hypothetical protein